jgi:hypothetical protein
MAGLSPSQGREMVNRMSRQQPAVLAYLLAAGEGLLNKDEQELLFYLGLVVWQMMLQGDTPLSRVTAGALEKAQTENIRMLEFLVGKPFDEVERTVAGMFKDYNQREVLKYVVEALTEEPEEGCLIQEENIGIMMVFLKTVVDCFDR